MNMDNERSYPDTAVVILAAGKGKRMKDPSKAKVMFEISGKPMIGHVLEKVAKLNPGKIILVVGNKKEDVIAYADTLNIPNLEYVEQKEQLGTGHAVDQARDELKDFFGDVLILAGDVPLLKTETLRNFINEHKKNSAELTDLSTIAPNPHGYGRIVRDSSGAFIKIVEEKDASENEKLIQEINSGIFLVEKDILFESLSKVKNNNAQGEYYLTDIAAIMKEQNRKVAAYPGADFAELQGVNSIEDLKKAQEVFDEMNK